MITDAVLADVDRELAELEARRTQLATRKSQHRYELQGKLMRLQFELAPLLGKLSAIDGAVKHGVSDPNEHPDVRPLMEAFNAAVEALAKYQPSGNRADPRFHERVDRERERLRTEAAAARLRYSQAFDAVFRPAWEAIQTAATEQRAEVQAAIAPLQAQIEEIEAELQRSTT